MVGSSPSLTALFSAHASRNGMVTETSFASMVRLMPANVQWLLPQHRGPHMADFFKRCERRYSGPFGVESAAQDSESMPSLKKHRTTQEYSLSQVVCMSQSQPLAKRKECIFVSQDYGYTPMECSENQRNLEYMLFKLH